MNLWEQIRRRDVDSASELELPPREGEAPMVRLRASEARRPAMGYSLVRPMHVVGGVLILVALVGYLGVYNQTRSRTPVLVAARDLPPGAVVRAGDLRVGHLAADRQTMKSLVRGRELKRVLGRTLASGLVAGTPLARAALAGPGGVTAAFTLVVPALHALGGAVEPGDRVTVLATFESASGRARARALSRSLTVLAVGRAPDGFDRVSATIPVTVALPDPSLASALALANAEGKIDLLREGTRGRGAPIPPVSEGNVR